jgi:hypothetical protein
LCCELQLRYFVRGTCPGKSARGTDASAVANFNQMASTG